ncbi:intraflagellar transport protein 88 homolog [Trichonephila inaurata madagascariensis]|uniref:Intraflagellar transport protein 88 homolog n=1 Tax=Trichonephila inaurata madagascariensis TaxID=2747483 RepID=A0A8X6X217_9ARAC|nr:intraflagellar transport protein 88 homolog [Trichonephila inaurata madagascariensis]
METLNPPTYDDDDLYSGYNEFHPSLDTAAIQEDEAFQQAVKTSYGKRPVPTLKVPGTSRLSTSRGGTGWGRTLVPSSSGLSSSSQEGLTRPMTAVRGAGFTSSGHRAPSGIFDPLNQAKSTVSPLLMKDENSPEERLKQLEKKVLELLEESCIAANSGEIKLALDKAKEAASKERALTRQRDQLALEITPNMDLTFSVLLNLATQYGNNEMYGEAMNTYQIIIKNRSFSNAGRLKTNMGNLCFNQGNYPKAIKFYRMALDQVPNTHRDMRIKIMKNIGLAFVKLGQYTDAITSYEYIMAEKADFRTALHLLLCHHALGDKEKMKRSFTKLLDIVLDHVEDEDKYSLSTEDPQTNLIVEAIKNDSLRKIERQRKQEAEWTILTAAKIIAPVIADTFAAGYEWCVDQIKLSPYADLGNDLEINKAVTYLRKREFNQAIETLKGFERKETKVASTAATNLAFLYYLQGDISQAEKCADQAVIADRYNAGALVNKGNCCLSKGDIEKAIDFFKEALSNEASCVEALYNLGLSYKKLNNAEDALESFYKLHGIVRNHPLVIYQIASLYEQLEDIDQALEWYQQVITLVPTDPFLLAKIGDMFDSEGDKQQAFQYHSDSYRYFPSNMEIIQKLGSYYIESQMFEEAIKFFERAAIIQPNQVKWKLMVAACQRRSGNYQQALEEYKSIHRKFPDDVECLRFLVRLCTDLGLKEATEYSNKLKKAEKAKEVKTQRTASSGSRPGSRRSSSRTSRDGSASSLSNASLPLGSPRQTHSGHSLTTSAKSLSNAQKILETDEFSPPEERQDINYRDSSASRHGRPKTAGGNKDDFEDEDIGTDLLPD